MAEVTPRMAARFKSRGAAVGKHGLVSSHGWFFQGLVGFFFPFRGGRHQALFSSSLVYFDTEWRLRLAFLLFFFLSGGFFFSLRLAECDQTEIGSSATKLGGSSAEASRGRVRPSQKFSSVPDPRVIGGRRRGIKTKEEGGRACISRRRSVQYLAAGHVTGGWRRGAKMEEARPGRRGRGSADF